MKVWILEIEARNDEYFQREHTVIGMYTYKNRSKALKDFIKECECCTEDGDRIEEFYMKEESCFYLCSQGGGRDYVSSSVYLYLREIKNKKRDYIIPSEDKVLYELQYIAGLLPENIDYYDHNEEYDVYMVLYDIDDNDIYFEVHEQVGFGSKYEFIKEGHTKNDSHLIGYTSVAEYIISNCL